MKEYDMQIEFVMDGNSAISKLVLYQNGKMIFEAKRLK